MSDLVPEEAIGMAAQASYSRLGASNFDALPEAHREGWQASARAGLEAAAPLILAAELRRLVREIDNAPYPYEVLERRASELLASAGE